MHDYLRIFLNTFSKVLLIVIGYVFGSIIFIFVVMSVVSEKFPPPVGEMLAQIQMAKKKISYSMQTQNEVRDTTNFLTSDGLPKKKSYHNELEDIMKADDLAPGENQHIGENQPAAENNDSDRELSRMRFEIDLLNTQMAQMKEEVEKLKLNSEKIRK